jgi:TolB-like protein/DNA-binding winged helix-turn-helix (wHTH) protein/Tfp pilus assembly protein PilF
MLCGPTALGSSVGVLLGGRSPADLVPMEPGAPVTGHSDNAGASLAAEYCVGDLIVNVQRERVTRKGHEIPLAKLSFDLLAMLIRKAPDLVSVESLMQQVWPGLVVGPETVSQRIKLIRDALDDDPKQPRYIAGVRGRGYRLVAPVERLRAELSRASAALEQEAAAKAVAEMPARADGGQRSKAWALRAVGITAGGALVLALGNLLRDRTVPTLPEETHDRANTSVVVAAARTIAVLPFADMSPNHDQEYFADGLSEELADRLSQLPGLRVIGRTSAFSFKGRHEDLRTIGKALGVNHMLEGSVRKEGNQLRITAQLVDSNGTGLWSHSYDQKLGDVFAIQDEVAKSVGAALTVTLTARQNDAARGGTRNAEAYDAYLAGKAIIVSDLLEDIRRGIALFEQAVALDPGFALAWSELALTCASSTGLAERNLAEWNAKVARATSRALEIAPEQPRVLAAAAMVAVQRKDWAEADRRLKKARDLSVGSDNVWEKTGWFLVTVGRPREAAQYMRRAGDAEPLLAFYPGAMSAMYEMSGDLDQAAIELVKSRPLFGNPDFPALNGLLQAMARHDRAQVEKAMSAFPATAFLGSMRSRLGEPQAALAELRRFAEDPGFPKDTSGRAALAYWAAYFGDPEFSLRLLHEVPADPSMAFVLWRLILKDTRRLPGFKDLVRDLGLVEYWRASGNWGEFCRPLGKDDFECT